MNSKLVLHGFFTFLVLKKPFTM